VWGWGGWGLHKFSGWVRAERLQLESCCAHEVHRTSKRIIQAFPLFDYGRSPDFPFASNHNAFHQLAGAPGHN